jgi:BarA-like signal transduction histidine kinase
VAAARGGPWHIDPRQGLAVAYRTAVETLPNQLLEAVLLGLLVATLVVVGVGRASPSLTRGLPAPEGG